MSIQVTLTFDSEDALIKYFMRDKATPPVTIVKPLPVQTPAPVVEKAYAEAAVPVDEPFEEPANDNPPSAADVQAALTAYGKTEGAMALKAVLDQFGARRLSEIKPNDYAAVLAAVKG